MPNNQISMYYNGKHYFKDRTFFFYCSMTLGISCKVKLIFRTNCGVKKESVIHRGSYMSAHVIIEFIKQVKEKR